MAACAVSLGEITIQEVWRNNSLYGQFVVHTSGDTQTDHTFPKQYPTYGVTIRLASNEKVCKA